MPETFEVLLQNYDWVNIETDEIVLPTEAGIQVVLSKDSEPVARFYMNSIQG